MTQALRRLHLRRGQVELTGDPTRAYCHCSSCRGWLGAPIHAATLWPTPNVKVVKGAEKLGLFKKTEASHRQFCTSCGSPVLVVHPEIGMTDVPVGTIPGFAYKPTLHVHYGEKVLAVKSYLCASGAEQHSHSNSAVLNYTSGDVVWLPGTRFLPGWSSYKPSFMKTPALVATEASKDLWAAFIRTMGTPSAARAAGMTTAKHATIASRITDRTSLFTLSSSW
jgi:hypothetical protein